MQILVVLRLLYLPPIYDLSGLFIDQPETFHHEKITEYQNKLRGLEAQKTEAENLEIVQLVRAMRLTPQELTAMLSGNGIPGIAPMPTDYDEQEDNADEE